jgi:aryl-alcohol dehydrogenase-like predicted oxidoreductase
MGYRTLGPSDTKISELAFGAWAISGWLWGGGDSKDAVQVPDNIKAVDFKLTEEENIRINNLLSNLNFISEI